MIMGRMWSVVGNKNTYDQGTGILCTEYCVKSCTITMMKDIRSSGRETSSRFQLKLCQKIIFCQNESNFGSLNQCQVFNKYFPLKSVVLTTFKT